MKKEKFDIVIIDSGVDINHPSLKSADISGISMVSSINGYIDELGHGTAICGIIFRHCPKAKIFVIKIVNDLTSLIEEQKLIEALNYIFDNIDCNLINISLGLNIVENQNLLYSSCKRLKDRGTIIIFAFDNSGAVSYPAAYDFVYGVESNNICKGINDLVYCGNSIVNLCAYGKSQRVMWLNSTYLVSGGSSYACAHASGIILNKQKEFYGINNDEIIRKSITGEIIFNKKNCSKKPCCLNYKNAAIYPFNKEIHSLLRYENLLQFNIIDVYDTKYLARVGASTDTLLGISENTNHIIKNIENIEWDEIDTIIIGHTKEMSDLIGAKAISSLELAETALKKGKYVYSFDDIFSEVESSVSLNDKYYSPTETLDADEFDNSTFGKLHKIRTPILEIIGTSSMQGKFSLQLILRHLFQSRGYTIAQLGSEPSSYLFGMDECYHFGYGSKHIHEPSYSIAQINKKMHNLDMLDRDLIIVGCQSNILASEINNIRDLTFPQWSFLQGTQPDGVVLCINEYDNIDYIKKSIKFAESVVDCKVIAIVLFPMTYSNKLSGIYSKKRYISTDEFNRINNLVSSEIMLPVYILGNEQHMDMLFTDIINFFS